MTVKEIIDGLKFTVDMFMFDPTTGETLTEPRNDMDKTTIDACKGAIELLEQTKWIPLNAKGYEPQKNGKYLVCFEDGYITALYYENGEWLIDKYSPIAWMPLPEPYRGERTEE